jgi:hypothetical protein
MCRSTFTASVSHRWPMDRGVRGGRRAGVGMGPGDCGRFRGVVVAMEVQLRLDQRCPKPSTDVETERVGSVQLVMKRLGEVPWNECTP